jgi:uncharacterized protein YjbK
MFWKEGMVCMSQHIEIEFKNMLSEEEFNKFLNYFQISSNQFFKQENHYYDTKDFKLKSLGCALRIRKKKDGYEMTLKQPHPDGLLETNVSLDEHQASALLNGANLDIPEIIHYITSLGIEPNELYYFGSLVTERAEVHYKGGLLVLDYSYYLNTKDYEVEYEVTNRGEGQIIFTDLLTQLNVPTRKTENKVKRFYNRKKELNL